MSIYLYVCLCACVCKEGRETAHPSLEPHAPPNGPFATEDAWSPSHASGEFLSLPNTAGKKGETTDFAPFPRLIQY